MRRDFHRFSRWHFVVLVFVTALLVAIFWPRSGAALSERGDLAEARHAHTAVGSRSATLSPRSESAEHEATRLVRMDKARSLYVRCGVEFWDKKVLRDAGAHSVDFTHLHSAKIGYLGTLAVLPRNTRSLLETHVVAVSGTLVKVKLEADSDIHGVLTDGQATMIVEWPNVGCTVGAQHRFSIFKARQKLESVVGHVGTSWVTVNRQVRIVGSLFEDYNHGQTGVAPNAIEVHPVTAMRFG